MAKTVDLIVNEENTKEGLIFNKVNHFKYLGITIETTI